MNRAERRRQEREARKNGDVINAVNNDKVLKRYTEEEFSQFIYDIQYKARIETIHQLLAAFALAEHRVHKHGHVRVKRSLDYINQLMDDINNEKTNFEKIKEECIKEIGINFIL
jgi:hypothetical protein